MKDYCFTITKKEVMQKTGKTRNMYFLYMGGSPYHADKLQFYGVYPTQKRAENAGYTVINKEKGD